MRARRSSHRSGGMRPFRDSTRASKTTLTAALVTGISWKSLTVLPTEAARAAFLNGILGAFCWRATRSTSPFFCAISYRPRVADWAYDSLRTSSTCVNSVRSAHSLAESQRPSTLIISSFVAFSLSQNSARRNTLSKSVSTAAFLTTTEGSVSITIEMGIAAAPRSGGAATRGSENAEAPTVMARRATDGAQGAMGAEAAGVQARRMS
mmetsp:Transcript_16793/g.46735  ORF Transcript_16793/g.46735 Transcript_16793/m.46735 type:complete len:208 (+) Transcript_16793:424-1047(+)